ncbi:hypothetical protein CsSME_00011451 [Camellia sinensis var. sinensis]
MGILLNTVLTKVYLRISCGNDLEDPKPKIVVFASNNIMEAKCIELILFNESIRSQL